MGQLFIYNEGSRAAIYGVGTYLQQLIHCANEGLEVNVVSLYSEKPEFTVDYENGIRIFSIPKNQLKYKDNQCDENYYLNSVYLLYNFIDVNKKVIFHFNYFRYKRLFSLLRELFPSSKIILTIHYFNWCFLLNGNTNYFKEIIHKTDNDLNILEKKVKKYYLEEYAILNAVDFVVCLSNYAKNLLISEYDIPEIKTSVVYNGLLDGNDMLTFSEKCNRKKNLYLSERDKVLLFVGRLDDIKGVDFMINAFKKVLEYNSNCILFIIGDGDFARYLQESKALHCKILFTGKLDKKELYSYYQIADVGIMLSKHEQCSFVAIEMMMHGIPILATDSTGLDEMVVNGVNGFKAKTIENKENVSFNIVECADLLTSMLKEEKNALLKKGSRIFYEAHYSLNMMIDKMQRLYNYI